MSSRLKRRLRNSWSSNGTVSAKTGSLRLTVAAAAIVISAGSLMTVDQAGAASSGLALGPKMATDHARFVAYVRSDGAPVVLDTSNRRVRMIRGAAGCRPVDIGARRVLLKCSSQFERFRPARTAPVLGGPSRVIPYSRSTIELTGIGRHWLQAQPVCPAACSGVSYVRRRDGATWTFSDGDPWPPRSLLTPFDFDLDRKRLKLRAHPGFKPPLNPREIVAFNRTVLVSENQGALRVWHSARSSFRMGAAIGADAGNSRGLAIGGGRITWVKGRTARAHDLSSGLTKRIRLPASGGRIAPVRGGVVLAVPVAGSEPRYRIRVLRLG
jgi:hypothetical protein